MIRQKIKIQGRLLPFTVPDHCILFFYSIARTCYEKRNKAVQVGEFFSKSRSTAWAEAMAKLVEDT